MLLSQMMNNFWQKIAKNRVFSCLAPMSDVTDCAFRKILVRFGKPDIMWTEFIAADGLCNKLARKKLSHILEYSHNEHPIVVQVFGANPENMKKACQYLGGFGFDGIDINMGCPDKSVVSQGAGAALIKTPELARKIIQAAKEGAPHLPISVKTRIGYNSLEYKTWLPEILKEGIAALAIHLRTKKEMSDVPAHWELAKDIVKTIRVIDKNVVLIANGDITNLEDGKKKALESGFDGMMIGRGVFGNPWLFDEKRKTASTIKEKLEALVEHTKLFEKLLGKIKNFAVMKKHFKSYVSGFDGAKELRNVLMNTNNSKEVSKIIMDFLKNVK
jgi:nifR3 family TIM-barrel protein